MTRAHKAVHIEFGAGGRMDEIERLMNELEGIHDALNDLSMSLLSGAISDGASVRPETEKKVSQARRAVAKAVEHLRGAERLSDGGQ